MFIYTHAGFPAQAFRLSVMPAITTLLLVRELRGAAVHDVDAGNADGEVDEDRTQTTGQPHHRVLRDGIESDRGRQPRDSDQTG